MHSLISIVGIVVTRENNQKEWEKMIRNTLIYNDLWKGICEEEDDNTPNKPTLHKELAIWENTDTKYYDLIVTSISE